MPGVAMMASKFCSAVRVSIMAKRDDIVVGLAQIDRLSDKPAKRHRPMRAPAALADRREFGDCGESPRVGRPC